MTEFWGGETGRKGEDEGGVEDKEREGRCDGVGGDSRCVPERLGGMCCEREGGVQDKKQRWRRREHNSFSSSRAESLTVEIGHGEILSGIGKTKKRKGNCVPFKGCVGSVRGSHAPRRAPKLR